MRMRSLGALLCASLLILGSSCSDDEDPVATDDTTEQSDGTDGLDEAQDALDDLDSIPGVDNSTLDDAQDALDDLDELQDNGCLTFMSVYTQMYSGVATMMGASEEDIAAMEAQLDEMQGNVPEEIADEVTIVSEAYGQFYEDIAGLTLGELGDIESPTDDPEVVAANEAITQWYEDNCSVE